MESQFHHCPVVLAQHRVLSHARAEKNVYELLSLPHRVNQQALPHIDIIDMREELKVIVPCFYSTKTTMTRTVG